jgi:phenylacetate-CoA ligase
MSTMDIYSELLRRLLLPLYYSARGRNYARYWKLLNESQWWTRDELLAYQWNELSALLDHVFANVPYYQEKYKAAGIQRGDIRCREDFERLPVLKRDEIRENRERLRAVNVADMLPHATGGSTGQPTRFYITRDSYDWRTVASQRAYSWTGCSVGELSLYLWGAPIGAVPRIDKIKKEVFHTLLRQKMVNTFVQTPELWQKVYEWHRRRRPTLIVGYVSSLEAYARYVAEGNLTPPPPRAVISAAEALPTAARQRIEAALGAPVFNTYGSREFMSIGGECRAHQGMHLNVENLLIETMPQTVDHGSDILITDLHNFGMPFVRYCLGDLGILDNSPCACARGLPRIRSIEGRTLDVLRTPEGRAVAGEFVPHLMKEFPEIRQYQVKQLSLDHIVISAILDGPLSATHQTTMQSELKKVFGEGLRIDFERVDEIPRLASGKRRVTIGMVQQ